jgi:predicted secreted protein
MAAKFPKGSLMQAGDIATATNFVTIPGVRSMSLANLTADKLDATSHDTPGSFRDWVQGLKDWGPISFEFLWDPTNAIHVQFFNDFKAGTERYYQLVIQSQGVTLITMQFKGFVGNFPFQVPFDALLAASCEIQIKGNPEPTLS